MESTNQCALGLCFNLRKPKCLYAPMKTNDFTVHCTYSIILCMYLHVYFPLYRCLQVSFLVLNHYILAWCTTDNSGRLWMISIMKVLYSTTLKINNSIIIYTGLQQQMYQSPFVKFILYFLEFLVWCWKKLI